MKCFLFCIALLALTGCNQKTAENSNPDNHTTLDTITRMVISNSIDYDTLYVEPPGKDCFTIEALLVDTLVPMEIQHEENTNPYEKYGFAFLANCYGCNGIDIYITDSVISLTGSCGEDLLSQAFRIEKKEATAEDEIIITVKNNARFIFSKVDTVAIYKLVIEGDLKLEVENMTKDYFTQPIEFYYTPRKELHKFAFYDCGDFQG